MHFSKFAAISIVFLSACATGGSGTYTGGGTVHSACADACIERTGNAKLCNDYLDKGRASCGNLVDVVCKAAPEQCGTKK